MTEPTMKYDERLYDLMMHMMQASNEVSFKEKLNDGKALSVDQEQAIAETLCDLIDSDDKNMVEKSLRNSMVLLQELKDEDALETVYSKLFDIAYPNGEDTYAREYLSRCIYSEVVSAKKENRIESVSQLRSLAGMMVEDENPTINWNALCIVRRYGSEMMAKHEKKYHHDNSGMSLIMS